LAGVWLDVGAVAVVSGVVLAAVDRQPTRPRPETAMAMAPPCR
jgi:hypothetical protein